MKKIFLFIAILSIAVNSFALDGKALFNKYSCSSCHAPDMRLVGPSLHEISKKYGTSEKAIKKVAQLIIKPNPANWPGFAYMPPFNIPMEEAMAIAKYVLIDSLKEKTERKEEDFDFEANYH